MHGYSVFVKALSQFVKLKSALVTLYQRLSVTFCPPFTFILRAAPHLQTNKLDSMLINAARYTARQFVGRVMELVPAFGGQELREENLLSYEQFRKVFEREKPQVSLLFNTSGAGYFAYCVIAPHLLESGVGTPIEADNAMTEIQDYLAKREEASGKRRVLVVDDSATVRQAMKVLR